MLIGYDGRFITEKTTGNGIHATRLIEALSMVDDHNQYRLYWADQDPKVTLELRKNVEIQIMYPLHRSAWVRVPILFPWELHRRTVDIFYAHYTVPARIWKGGDLFGQITKAGLEDRVVTTGYVPDEDMSALYQGAEVFCYPSLYEGFGFPILEAMASGVPVVASQTSSCPEVGGPAVLYFDPLRVESIAEGIHRMLKYRELRSKKHVEAGIQRVRRFSWEETAKRTVDVYRGLAWLN